MSTVEKLVEPQPESLITNKDLRIFLLELEGRLSEKLLSIEKDMKWMKVIGAGAIVTLGWIAKMLFDISSKI